MQEAKELEQLLAEVRRIEMQSLSLVTDVMAGGYSSVFRGAGIEFDEVREYVPGDDPRSVDWNVTARTGRPYVKKFVEERELTVLFAIDLSASMRAGSGAWSLRQTAARAVACLALSAVDNDDKVGMLAFSGGVDRYLPPGKGAHHAMRIVRDCLALAGSGEGTALGPALERLTALRRRRAIVFVVSDFIATGYEATLPLCARRHDIVAVRLAPPELTPPPADVGMLRVRDPESGFARIIDWRSTAVRAAYSDRVAAWQAHTDRALRRARVDCIDIAVPTAPDIDAVAGPILDFFRMRSARAIKR